MIKTRTLLGGKKVSELNKAILLKVYTKCPEKYMLIDMETGERYLSYSTEGPSNWKKLETCPTST
jgi:hypothetical protein